MLNYTRQALNLRVLIPAVATLLVAPALYAQSYSIAITSISPFGASPGYLSGRVTGLEGPVRLASRVHVGGLSF